MADDLADTDRKNKRKAGKTAEDAPRRAGLRALAVSLPKATRHIFGRRGFAEGGLAIEWPSIVGAQLAALCVPGKLSFAYPSERREGTLTLRVESAFATEAQHLAPLLIERVNGYFGYRAVARLRLQQGPLAPRGTRAPAPPALSAEDEMALKRRLDQVEDPELRAALGRLGRALGTGGPA